MLIRPPLCGAHLASSSEKAIHLRTLSRRFVRLLFDLLVPYRNFFFWCDFVLRFGNAEQPMIEPAQNILQSLNPVPWLARSRELVRFVREPHHHRRDFAKLERAEHFLAARTRRSAVIGFA